MATTPNTTTRKEWKPNEKQTMFMDALKVLGSATFREIKKYILDNYGETIATGSVNVLTTKSYVGTREQEFDIETTTTYIYPNGSITETKNSTKKEKVYYLIGETERAEILDNIQNQANQKSTPAEDDLDDIDLVDMEG